MYVAGSAIALLFYILEKQLATLLEEDEGNTTISKSDESGDADDGSNEEGGDPWKEFAKGMTGMHFIFDPFIPCLLWSLIVRYYWLREGQAKKVSPEKKDMWRLFYCTGVRDFQQGEI